MDNQEKTDLPSVIGNSEDRVSVPYNRAVISNHKHQIKSHRYDDSLLMELARRLNSIAYAMGFRDIEIDTVSSLAKWIKEHFGDISMQEVALAFDLVTAKKIGNNIRHYAEFSQQYIGDVLHAFKTYRAQQIKLFEDHQKQKAIEENTSKGATGQEMYEGIKRMALETGKIMKVADWTSAYSYAWNEKLIHRMNEKERQEYKEGIIEDLKTKSRAGFTSKPIGEIIGNEHSLQGLCHKKIMEVHFQQLIDKHQTS